MQETPQKDRHVLRIIFIEGAANLVVLGAKLAVGISTGSLAIIGDAIHSFTDVLNNGVAWLVVKHSSAPPDAEHPYGHRKFETLAVFGLATLLAVFAFELALQAIRREDSVVTTGGWELLLMLAVLVINVVLSAWQRFWARKLNSDILLADASHTFADVLTSTVVIIGWQLSAMGVPMAGSTLRARGFRPRSLFGVYSVSAGATRPDRYVVHRLRSFDCNRRGRYRCRYNTSRAVSLDRIRAGRGHDHLS